MARAGDGELIRATPRRGFARVFAWYARRLLRSRFHRVRLTPEGRGLLRGLDGEAAPLIICCTHASWWDPLVGLVLQRELLPSRAAFSPMDADQLRRFAFFRKVGLFGIDPDDPASLAAMTSHVSELVAAHPRLTLALTPQGRFADPREPVRIRPGAAALAARLEIPRVVCVAIEYAFWQDQKPEVFVHAVESWAEAASTTGWQRAIATGMQEAADELAQRVISREPAGFEIMLGAASGRATATNPVHALWLTLRGRSGEIEARRAGRTTEARA
ncbi:MAG: lysophospholipid acyltransferase family protein [Phycisphaeraceae bacterium]|nr:lysophospholipid acyltransferase family protein [Phycisphaeraceae bacterium]MBX3406034.1 lysophospholipid acyltransferase family protein [Phycisphaeraceae bacterium]